MDQQLNDKIIQIFVTYLNKDINTLNSETTFSENNLDELDVIEAVMRVEDDFHVEISDDESDNFKSIQDITACVESKLAS
jgi:acyl carrier protein